MSNANKTIGKDFKMKERTRDQAKQMIKWLGQNSNTTRAGTPSSRNKSKQYRPQRLIKDKFGNEIIDPLENMKQGVNAKGEETTKVTNGTFGIVSSFLGAGVTGGVHKKWKREKINGKTVGFKDQESVPDHETFHHYENPNMDRGSRMVHYTKATAGRSRNAPKKKASGLPIPTVMEIEQLNTRFLMEIRDKLVVAKLKTEIGDLRILNDDELYRLGMIEQRIRQLFPKEELLAMLKRDGEREKSMRAQYKSGHLGRIKDVRELRKDIESAWLRIQSEKPTEVHPSSVIGKTYDAKKEGIKAKLGEDYKFNKESKIRKNVEKVTPIILNRFNMPVEPAT